MSGNSLHLVYYFFSLSIWKNNW